MTERLLQYIWQFQYFNNSELATTEGEPLFILHPGSLNTNQGADFLEAKIKAGTTTWAGNIEIHINSSHWKNHKHSDDENYKNVVLHVVWLHDAELQLPFPTVELQGRISKLLLNKYTELMNNSSFIPCEKSITQIASITWAAWKERLLVERLQQKSQVALDYLSSNNNHWEETFWWMLAKNFGAKVNAGAFEKIARSLSLNILAKHKNQIQQTEALLFGQASLLSGTFTEAYPAMLQKEYAFLQIKYRLEQPKAPLYFLRMRPSNFPSVRLAQLAMLIHNSIHLFSKINETVLLKDVKALLDVTANDYWHYHYMLDEPGNYKPKKLGTQMVDNILINTVITILFAYGHFYKESQYKDKALQWLEELTAEKNNITKGFTALGIQNKTAFDSQALIQLKNEYCNKKRCLDCAVGNKLLKGF